ncbi:MAG: transposase [Gammaproteobacteria bacterium]|nr:transposase [Gammaproteobacteria bacterium]
MSRPLRIEYPGAVYHITSRGNRQEDIYFDDEDRNAFLNILANVCDRYNWVCHSYCLMSNHYHLLIETPEANLSMGMRQLNGVYTQSFNRNHHRVGHTFQGRYKAILVQKDSYLLELSRYIVLNPVRAGMVRSVKDWRWSSYRSTAGLTTAPEWLKIDWLLSCFARRKKLAMERYREFVSQGRRKPSPWNALRKQIYLGDDEFVEKMLSKLDPDADLTEVPSGQRRKKVLPVQDYLQQSSSRNEGIYQAYQSGGYTMKAISDATGLHYSTVSKIIKGYEDSYFKT